MKKLFSLIVLSMSLQMASAQNVKVIDLQGRSLETEIGDGLLTTDSIVIKGEVMKDDYQTLARMISDGKLSGINMSGCITHGDTVYSLTNIGEPTKYPKGLRYFRFPQNAKVIAGSFKQATLYDFSVPSSVRTINQQSFLGSTFMDDLHIEEGIDSIGYMAFYGARMPKNVYLPSTLRVIDTEAFWQTPDNATETNLWCNGMTPPQFNNEETDNGPFNESNYETWTLYVPNGAKSAYESDTYFGKFKNIIESEPTGISSSCVERNTCAYKGTFDLTGKRLDNVLRTNSHGVYVVDGKKILK